LAYETKVEYKGEYSVATGVLDIYTWWLEVKVRGMGRGVEGRMGCLYNLFSSFVPSVVSLWNSLPDHVKVSPLSVFKARVSH